MAIYDEKKEGWTNASLCCWKGIKIKKLTVQEIAELNELSIDFVLDVQNLCMQNKSEYPNVTKTIKLIFDDLIGFFDFYTQ